MGMQATTIKSDSTNSCFNICSDRSKLFITITSVALGILLFSAGVLVMYQQDLGIRYLTRLNALGSKLSYCLMALGAAALLANLALHCRSQKTERNPVQKTQTRAVISKEEAICQISQEKAKVVIKECNLERKTEKFDELIQKQSEPQYLIEGDFDKGFILAVFNGSYDQGKPIVHYYTSASRREIDKQIEDLKGSQNFKGYDASAAITYNFRVGAEYDKILEQEPVKKAMQEFEDLKNTNETFYCTRTFSNDNVMLFIHFKDEDRIRSFRSQLDLDMYIEDNRTLKYITHYYL